MKLTISHLSKQYRRDFWGLRDFDLELGPCVIGLLGPNGAGKSTLMRMFATITQPTESTVKWNDTDIVKSPDTLRSMLGYLPQDFGIYPNLTSMEFLEYIAAIKGMDAKSARRRIEELLVLVNLVHAAKRPLGGYSGGVKQRVGIAQALLNQLPAAWLSGFVITALLGSGALFKFIFAGETFSIFGWLTGALFIPSLALALGVFTGSCKAFEALYVLWMYILSQKAPAFDFAGITPDSPLYLYVPLAMSLFAIAMFARQRQLKKM